MTAFGWLVIAAYYASVAVAILVCRQWQRRRRVDRIVRRGFARGRAVWARNETIVQGFCAELDQLPTATGVDR